MEESNQHLSKKTTKRMNDNLKEGFITKRSFNTILLLKIITEPYQFSINNWEI